MVVRVCSNKTPPDKGETSVGLHSGRDKGKARYAQDIASMSDWSLKDS